MLTQDKAVQDAILFIQQNLDKNLSLSTLAKEAAYSPYHFSRMFKRQVGTSPMYFISSLRLQLAKKLLLDTAFPIRDIGLEVGQQSLGTFTTRFTNSIGMSPASFRATRQHSEEYMTHLKQKRSENTIVNASSFQQLSGSIQTEEAFNGIIFAGLFPKPIPEGLPVRGTLLMHSDSFHITNIPVGTYFLMATAVSWEMDSKTILIPRETLRARHPYPICIDGKRSLPETHLIMRKPEITDPPILISLPLLMKHFLQRSSISH
ncbi:helix-turn-helix domain-containing protein [Oceanobacillus sojae]|uniref:helix-turn-helix domain-containing protein n=1 Tax=Oceanobacillus sojae TaxID=582851 RepID=UPI00098874C2|nr:helix-turn-helix transcriptional regulator [Oceanobacillus sojae]MCT1902593.1 helix-turn-helix transcriptional regulator [Oceanobacillus sojae]